MDAMVSVPVAPAEILHFGIYSLDLWRKDVSCGEKTTRLTPAEAVIFRKLGEHIGNYVPHIEMAVTYADYFQLRLRDLKDVNTMAVTVNRLKRKLSMINPSGVSGILIKRKVGYTLEVSAPSVAPV